MTWLMDGFGSKGILPLGRLKNVGKTRGEAQVFLDNYSRWQNAVKNATNRRDYFDDKIKGGRIVGIVVGLLLAGLFVLLHLLAAQSEGRIIGPPSWMWVIPVGALVVYPLIIKRRSRTGSQKYHEWNAFRRFLLHFSNLKEAGEQSVAIWEHYLVYAVTLGVAKQVIKQLKMVLPADPSVGTADPAFLFFTTRHLMMTQVISSSLSQSVSHAITTSRSTVSASSSGGGGFTGGGGGGFGVGGGSGRF